MIHVEYIFTQKLHEGQIEKIRQLLPHSFKYRVSGKKIVNKQTLLGRYLLFNHLQTKGYKLIEDKLFEIEDGGKLSLQDAPDFNISHTKKMVALAINSSIDSLRLGIDIEKKREIDVEGIQSYFTEAERIYLQKSPIELKSSILLELWTRKEAYYKAKGIGIYHKNSLRKIECLTNEITEGQEKWNFHKLFLGDNHVGTCVANSRADIILKNVSTVINCLNFI